MGWVAFFENFIQIACLLFAWALVLLAFFILAIQLFITLIEFKLTTLAGFVLIPFGLFGKTAFMAERVLGNVISSGIKVLVLAVIIGIGSTLFSQFTAGFGGVTPTIDEAMAVVLAALSLLGLGIFGPGIANGIVSGGPQLGAGAAVGTGLAVGGAALAGAGAAGLAARGGGMALSGTAAAASGGVTAAGGAATAYSLGSAGQSGAAGVASGLGAVASTGARAAVSPLRRASANASGSLRQSFQAGGRAAFETTGGTVGNAGSAATAAAAPSPSSASGGPPDWAKRMKRSQRLSHGVQAAAHAVRSGDSHGGASSVNLSEGNRS
jgi:type IV secretion system protein TrbL